MSEFEKAVYYGFTLKKDYWYGVDTETGRYIATSGWENNGYVAIYFNNGNLWDIEWIDIEETEFTLENLPEVCTKGKMSFPEWLRETYDISWSEYDEYPTPYIIQIDDEYSSYLYDGLPKFAQKYL